MVRTEMLLRMIQKPCGEENGNNWYLNTKMNFKELIIDTYNNYRSWDYYSSGSIRCLNIENPDECRIFIHQYFSISGKVGCIDDWTNLDSILTESPSRCQHIVYTFLLGMGIYNRQNLIKELIDTKIKYYSTKYGVKSHVTFAFVWFLCCLFHDLGYPMENSRNIDWDFRQKDLDKTEGVPGLYKNTLKRYLQYIKKEHHKTDHGIYAGVNMYKMLCDNRTNQEQQCDNNSKLCWEKALENIYNIASWIIMCHNIWLVNNKKKRDVDIFIEYKLYKLTYDDGEYKINLKDSPLFFFFCLIDTIEPIKRVKETSLLEKTYISIEDNQITIHSDIKCGCGDRYMQDIENVGNWLTKIRKEENKIIINIK